MKNLGLYYLTILLPLPVLFYLGYTKHSMLFVTLLMAYVLFRNIIDGLRLNQIGKIDKKEIWKTNLFLYQIKYFKSLYFGV